MSVPSIEPAGFTPYLPPTISAPAPGSADAVAAATTGTTGTTGPSGPSFGDVLAGGIDRLQSVHDRADTLAVQAATGDLSNLHDYTIAATEAAVTTQLTTAVRNKALEAFTEIMRMSI
jgi:flagellar hook-basal body complex protein FliE